MSSTKVNQQTFFHVFSSFFIFSFIYHIGEKGDEPLHLVTLITFCLVFYFSTLYLKKILLFIYIVFIIAWKGSTFPNLANHSVLQVFLCLYLLTIYIRSFIKKTDTETVFFKYKKYLGLYLAWVYFIAGFHKLNYDFLNPETSCANWYHDKVLRYLQIDFSPPAFMDKVSPYAALAVEILGAAILLIMPVLGVLIFTGLHYHLSIGGFADFAGIAISILITFLPSDTINKIYKHKIDKLFLIGAIIGISLTYVHTYGIAFRLVDFLKFRFLQGVFLIISTSPIIYFIFKLKINIFKFNKNNYQLLSIHGLFFLALVFYSINPYLGLNTSGTFTMFSNLRTEQNKTNHLLVPNAQLFNYQKENITVFSTEPKYLRDYFEQGKTMPYVHFKYLARQYLNNENENFSILVKHKHGTFEINNSNIDYESWVNGSFFEKHYLKFRAYNNMNSVNYCRW